MAVAGLNCRRTDNLWGKRGLKRRPRLDKRSAGRPRLDGMTIFERMLEDNVRDKLNTGPNRPHWGGL